MAAEPGDFSTWKAKGSHLSVSSAPPAALISYL